MSNQCLIHNVVPSTAFHQRLHLFYYKQYYKHVYCLFNFNDVYMLCPFGAALRNSSNRKMAITTKKMSILLL